ncbi:fimbria/pilus outer membrane usher protein [Herbaspirillum sp.]|uniref:fimbria/pilus outer membrane usher protein n=1 Tax=Herbaspirillum sp. TaxID=1890675 RepID=UPI001B089052|nr:fimbria/pilus outer membrane usher protein [Herbaspirillum sp.]MBO9537920.1 fimbrial biogenesis outer membrane usher protein [Herbaspirillum sp.]
MKNANLNRRSADLLHTPLTRACAAVLLALGGMTQAMGADPVPATPAGAAQQPAASPATAEALDFNSDFLTPQPGTLQMDLSRYARGNPVLPGEYRVDLYLNGQPMGPRDVLVKAGDDPQRGRICMTQALLDQVGLDWAKLSPEQVQAFSDPQGCAVLEEHVENAHAVLDTGELRLDVTLAQVLLRRSPRGYVNPKLWNSGVTAGMLGYSFNAYHNRSGGSADNSAYLGVNAGLNLGGWYFRHNASMNWHQNAPSHYDVLNTYVTRDLPSLTSRLTLGEANTSGELFDTLPFTGIQVGTDERMLPDSQRGYAPLVRGVAETNARVTIRQNGVVIHDAPVPPGPFEIDDLYPTGYGGNLEVTVTEADGRKRSFLVPYASVAQLLRPGTQRYSLTAGTLRNRALLHTPKLLQGTYQRGLTNSLTAYGGVQASENYGALLGGMALGTSLGAFSLDLTRAQTRTVQETLTGSSVRVGYSKFFEETSSNVSVAAYRFSTRGFLDFTNAAQAIDAVNQGQSIESILRPRNRVSLTLNQALGEGRGQLFVTGFAQNYWGPQQKDVQFQAGYTNTYRSMSYTVSVNRVRISTGGMDNRVMVNLTIPLGKTQQAPQFGFTMTSQPSSGTSTQATLAGTAGEEREWGYGVTATHGPGDAGTTGSLNGQYRSRVAALQAGYAQGAGYSSTSAGISGTVVAHPGGVTLSPYTGDTIAIVAAPEAAGARVTGYQGLTLDGRGYGVVPYLTPYRMNEVAIDPKGLSTDVELKTTSQQVAPRAGAVVMLSYATATGRAALIDATLPDGSGVPFGADVTDGSGNNVGTVAQGGRIFVRLAQDSAELTVRWGEAPGQQCKASVTLPPRAANAKGSTIDRLTAACLPPQ